MNKEINYNINMESRLLISVVVPVYNVEEYLDECIKSLVSQTYRDLEIIIVDDKSPDASGRIADEWATNDERIKVVHKAKNEGLNMARKTGYDASKGELVAFIDSDDVIDKMYIEKLHRSLIESDSDISICGYASFESVPKFSTKNKWVQRIFLQDEIIMHYATRQRYLSGYSGNLTNAYCRLFKRSVLEGVDWKKSNYTLGEDDFFSLYAFASAKKISIIYDELYHYRINPTSLSRSSELNVRYNGKKISVFQIVENYKNQALELLGEDYKEEIYYHTYDLYNYYFNLLFVKGAWSEYEFNGLARVTATSVNDFLSIKKYPVERDLLLDIRDKGVISWFSNIIISERKLNEGLRGQITLLQVELSRCTGELNSFLGIKRSSRLVAGNIMRRLGKR